MFKLTLTEGIVLAIVGGILTIVLVVLDKAGKLKGPMLLVLLAVAAFLTLPLVLNLGWISNAHGPAKAARVLLVLCAVGLLYSTIGAWVTFDDNDSNEGPRLVVDFWRIGSGRPAKNDKDAVITLLLNVKNVGSMPTIALDWSLTVTMPNQAPMSTIPRYILPTEPVTLARADGGPPDVYDPSDALYNKTLTTPIQPGAAVTGILLFTLPNVNSDGLNQKGTTFTLTCVNVRGDKVSAFYALTGGEADEGANVYYPGLKELPRPPRKLTYSQETAPSNRKDAPYAVRVTIRTNIPLQPTSIAVKCTSEFVASENQLLGAPDTAVSNAGDGYVGNRSTYWFYFNEPPFKPETPVVILLMAKQPIRVLSVEIGPPLPKN